MTSRAAVDLEAAAAFLKERFAGTREVEAFGHGEWSAAFGFVCDEGPMVARFSGYRMDYEKDRIASTFPGPDLPIPEVIEVGDALGGAFAVSRRLPGEPLMVA
ncbi:MAG: hypothetical protein R3C39_08665 [Dehalococcoidia bacterium]